MTTLYQAGELARSGLGHEDIFVRLRKYGLTRLQARVAVFGARVAHQMQERDIKRRAMNVRKAS